MNVCALYAKSLGLKIQKHLKSMISGGLGVERERL